MNTKYTNNNNRSGESTNCCVLSPYSLVFSIFPLLSFVCGVTNGCFASVMDNRARVLCVARTSHRQMPPWLWPMRETVTVLCNRAQLEWILFVLYFVVYANYFLSLWMSMNEIYREFTRIPEHFAWCLCCKFAV